MRVKLIYTSAIDGPRALARDVARRLRRRVTRRWASTGPPERGDVPGWVLITLMTAGLVLVLWAIAGPALRDVFTNAINSVTGKIG